MDNYKLNFNQKPVKILAKDDRKVKKIKFTKIKEKVIK
jgi:hypothetical protein